MDVTVEITQAVMGLARFQTLIHRLTRRAMEHTVTRAETVARQTHAFHDRTGKLRRSIRSGITQDDPDVIEGALSAGDTAPGASYAEYVELGTTPHVIRPRVKHALWWEGAAHPVPRVRHPGTAPRPFVQPAMLQVAVLEQTVEATLKTLLDAWRTP